MQTYARETLVSGNIQFMRIADIPGGSWKETSNDSGVFQDGCTLSNILILSATCVVSLPILTGIGFGNYGDG